MSGAKSASLSGVKRKRDSSKSERSGSKSKSRPRASSDDSNNVESEIVRLETQILESRRHYNNIATLLQIARQPKVDDLKSLYSLQSHCAEYSHDYLLREICQKPREWEKQRLLLYLGSRNDIEST